MMPLTPFSTAKRASSTVSIPLRIIGSDVVLQQFDPDIRLICLTHEDDKRKSNVPDCQDKESSQTMICRYLLSHLTSSQDRDASNSAVTYSLRPEPLFAAFIRFAKSPSKFANLKTESVQFVRYQIKFHLSSMDGHLKWLGNENLFLRSARLSPKHGASTVRTSALKPARSARLIKFKVTFLSV